MDALANLRLILLASASGLAFAVSGADAARRVTGVEPGPEQLAPVDPAWKAAGWRAVVPHAYVVTNLLAVRVAPDSKADIAYHLKGGVRVPVLEQQRDWWKIQWTGGRTGWARAADLQPRATVLLLDASTGRLRRRIAAKGQWGYLSDGKRLWSLANTGLTRTELTDSLRLWAYPTTRELDGNLPREGLITADRRTLFFPARDAGKFRLGRVDTDTGGVQLIAAPRGEPAGLTSGSEEVVLTREGASAVVVSKEEKPRRISGDLLAVGKDGSIYVKRGRSLLRTDAQGRVLARTLLPKGFRRAVLTAEGASLAVSYDAEGGDPENKPDDLRLRLLHLRTLKLKSRLTVNRQAANVLAVLRGAHGWLVVETGAEAGISLTRYDSKGVETGAWDAFSGHVFDPKRGIAYIADGEGLIRVALGRGKARTWKASWRRTIPEGLLPKDPASELEVWPEISAVTLSPDGRTLIVTERLAGDPQG